MLLEDFIEKVYCDTFFFLISNIVIHIYIYKASSLCKTQTKFDLKIGLIHDIRSALNITYIENVQ